MRDWLNSLILDTMNGKATSELSTAEIMKLTRDDS
jgi:hypothetical protein